MIFQNETPGLEDLNGDAWPDLEDNLISVGEHTVRPVFLATGPGGSYHRIEGYRRAAELLYAQATALPHLAHQLIYPLGNCWRHHIELQIKLLLEEVRRVEGMPAPEDRDRGHSTLRLWRRLSPMLDSAIGGPDPDSPNVLRLLGQLDELDSTGEDFRYAEANKTRPILAGLNTLDLDRFHEGVAGVSSFLDASLTAVTELESLLQEVKSMTFS